MIHRSGVRAARATWDGIAPRYHGQVHLERQSVRAAVRLADPASDEVLLDLGTGTGAVLSEVLSRARPPARAWGVDRSPGMLARAPALPAGWELVVADLDRLPLESGCVDVAIASYVLHLLGPAERARGLAEARRVLVPGGRLVITVPYVPRRGLATITRAFFDAAADLAPARLGGLRALDPRDELRAQGWELMRAVTLRRGYPAICVLATS